MHTTAPRNEEYPPFYHPYIALVFDENLDEFLSIQEQEFAQMMLKLPKEKGTYRYRPEKWTIQEVVGHIIDTERVMAYRILCIGRGENKSLPGFEQDDYVKGGNFNERTIEDLVEEFSYVRKSNLHMVRHLNAEALSRSGIANEKAITANALVYIVAGHMRHHVNILKEKYL